PRVWRRPGAASPRRGGRSPCPISVRFAWRYDTRPPRPVRLPRHPDIRNRLPGRTSVRRAGPICISGVSTRAADFPAVGDCGRPASVTLEVQGGQPRFFQGFVSRFAQGSRDDTFITYRAELVPPVWLLTRRVQSRIFQHVSVPDILKAVFDGFPVAYQLQGTFH